MQAKLIVLSGTHKGREIPLPETIFLIGRDTQCHLRLHCQGVSKLHCAIAAWGSRVRVRDLKSRNGTFLNAQQIHGETAAADGDQLQVGSLVFALRVISEVADPSTSSDAAPEDVNWLLQATPDSSVLSPTCQTRIVSLSDLLAADTKGNSGVTGRALPGESGAPGLPPGSKAVSAGERLRTFVQARQRRPIKPQPRPEQK